MNLLSVKRIYNWFIISFTNWLWIHYFFRELTVYSLSLSRFTLDPLSFPRIHNEYYQLRKFTINLLSFSRYQYGSFTFFVNSELISYLFREFTISSLSVTRIHQGFIILFVINIDPYNFSLIQNWFEFFSRNHCGSIIISVNSLGFANSLRIHYLFRIITVYSLSGTRIH